MVRLLFTARVALTGTGRLPATVRAGGQRRAGPDEGFQGYTEAFFRRRRQRVWHGPSRKAAQSSGRAVVIRAIEIA